MMIKNTRRACDLFCAKNAKSPDQNCPACVYWHWFDSHCLIESELKTMKLETMMGSGNDGLRKF